jgi:hypothetical protein
VETGENENRRESPLQKGRVLAAKYHCPMCGRRFVEWGAQNLEFKCPGEGCDQAVLVLPGTGNDNIGVKPKSKRSKKTPVPVTNPEDRVRELDAELIDEDGDCLDAENDDNVYEEDEEDEEAVILEKETAKTESCQPDKTKRSLPVGDTKGKKEKSKAQKQKSVKDANTAKVKKDKAPKSKPS